MPFNDKLKAALIELGPDEGDRAERWRQLVELVANGGDADRDLVDQALAQIRSGASDVEESARVEAALAVAPLQLPAGLVSAFAADRVAVAAPVLARARLTAGEWESVSAAASEECREFIAGMRSEQAPAPNSLPDNEFEPVVPVQQPKATSRAKRSAQSSRSHSASAGAVYKLSAAPQHFHWECNEAGEITWVHGVARGPLIGRSIAQRSLDWAVDRSVERAFAARAPFHEATLDVAGAGEICGTWKMSGAPAFEPLTGRFAGYAGVAERSRDAAVEAARSAPADSDSLRELAHEIKTPLNAIIGFAEIITGEYLGPAETRYRDRARDIVGQARLLLGAVEDIDLAARLRAGADPSSSDLADCIARSWDEISSRARRRGVALDLTGSDGTVHCALNQKLAQRLVTRLFSAVTDCAADGEKLTVRVGSEDGYCVLSVNRPASLVGADLRPQRNRRASDSGTLPLRLAIGLARTAGGEIDTSGDQLVLRLPEAGCAQPPADLPRDTAGACSSMVEPAAHNG